MHRRDTRQKICFIALFISSPKKPDFDELKYNRKYTVDFILRPTAHPRAEYGVWKPGIISRRL
jgi:hypothetical protein